MKRLIFVCSLKDFHAMDWFKSAKKICNHTPYIITDSISSEGFKSLHNKNDIVYKLVIIDKFLFSKMSFFGNIWRNTIKLIFLPIQAYLLKRFDKKYPNNIFFAHSMYNIWLCYLAGVKFIGAPQGSEILIRSFKSKIYKYLSRLAMKASLFITCDSKKMAKRIFQISSVQPIVIENGIDMNLISELKLDKNSSFSRSNEIVSFRGLNPLYRIENIFQSRNLSERGKTTPIRLIYPFSQEIYKKQLLSSFTKYDHDIGRLNKKELMQEFTKYYLYISIPKSDSSPRSVYECIFCGGVVATTKEDYYEELPNEMKERIILVNLQDKDWLDKALEKAHLLNNKQFKFTKTTINQFDQIYSFKKIYNELRTNHNLE